MRKDASDPLLFAGRVTKYGARKEGLLATVSASSPPIIIEGAAYDAESLFPGSITILALPMVESRSYKRRELSGPKRMTSVGVAPWLHIHSLEVS
jgi:hypothetical protein